MKKNILLCATILLCAGTIQANILFTVDLNNTSTTIDNPNKEYYKGYYDGWDAGWKSVKGKYAHPITPPHPNAPRSSHNTYGAGFELGFKLGAKRAKK
tara:strand:+ start:2460 stop:2753 length:294 start_codon:yes stop_codon:yes gene_type:complete